MGCSSSSSVVDIRRTVVTSGSTVVVWSVTDHERNVIKRTWRIISRRMNDVGTNVFLDIFHRRPDLQQLFPFRHVEYNRLAEDSGFKRHVNKIMQTIGAMVDNIDDLEATLGPIIQNIGKHHTQFAGFDIDLCDVFTTSLLQAWKQGLDSRYKADTGRAWKQLFDFLVVKLAEGYGSEITCLHEHELSA